MKPEEQRALAFLKESGLDPVYEPNGYKTAPDFVVSNSIAVEVTRLNQHFVKPSGVEGLENALFSLTNAFFELVHHFQPKCPLRVDEPSWFVHFTFRRPIKEWSCVRPQIVDILEQFASGDHKQRSYQVNSRLDVFFSQAEKRHASFFRIGGCRDQDAWGWALALITANLKLCLERGACLLPRLTAYSERWLILVDLVNLGSWEPFETEQHDWDRLIILSPGGPMKSYEPPQALPPYNL